MGCKERRKGKEVQPGGEAGAVRKVGQVLPGPICSTGRLVPPNSQLQPPPVPQAPAWPAHTLPTPRAGPAPGPSCLARAPGGGGTFCPTGPWRCTALPPARPGWDGRQPAGASFPGLPGPLPPLLGLFPPPGARPSWPL